ncbi:unnamed protein product [Pseudo-nitzschia multistriata]|uniref:RRM domain-containing protein n=1 Tax=Pseudo-nitzschia multistriata TaxID=183589 RepID=A0A448ZGL2_9STRA|nr:unnamed protein product [Pseudo-nitzschia multistriata]
MKTSAGLILSFLASATAWTSPSSMARTRQQSALKMAIDYNDPVVAEEFAKVQPMTWEEIEEELNESGIPAPPSMSDMDLKLMLVEMRLRLTGRLDGDKAKERPTTFKSAFEEAIWTKPAFAEFYKIYEDRDDHNSMNVIKEMLNIPDIAQQRYSTSYASLLEELDFALNAPPPVNSPTLLFSGFPSNMGEAALKMTLEALGEIEGLECEEDESFPILRGTVTFADIESAKACVAQYNGMDMGMGTLLEITSV